MEIDLVVFVTLICLMSGASSIQTPPPDAPPTISVAPPSIAESRVTGVGAPSSSAGAPASSAGAPASSVGAPASSVGAPASSVGAPGSSVGAPASSVGAPASSVGAPGSGSSVGPPGPSFPAERNIAATANTSTTAKIPSASTVTPGQTNSTRIKTPTPAQTNSTSTRAQTYDPLAPEFVRPFTYDYHSLRVVGLSIGSVLFVLGIMVVACGRLRRVPRCHTGPSKSYQVKPIQDVVMYEVVPTS